MNIPCKDCLIFPLCSASYSTSLNPTPSIFRLQLMRKCSLLYEYLIGEDQTNKPPGSFVFISKRVSLFHSTFNVVNKIKEKSIMTFPCKDCLTFPICLSSRSKIYAEESFIIPTKEKFRILLENKCSLLKTYIQENINEYDDKECYKIFNSFFNLYEYQRLYYKRHYEDEGGFTL